MNFFNKLYKVSISGWRCMLYKLRYGKRLKVKGIVSLGPRFNLNISQNGYMEIGNRLVTFQDVSIASSGKMKIGERCFFNSNVSINCMEKIYIGEKCEFGNNIVIVDHDHNYRVDNKEFLSAPIIIGKNVWIGANSVILRGTSIGDNCVIAAGSIVKGEIPDNTLYYEKREGRKSVIQRRK